MEVEKHNPDLSVQEGEVRQAPLWVYMVAYVVPYITLAMVAVHWPAHSGLFGIDFTNSRLATMVPSISAYIEKSKFPHATAAYFVLSAFIFMPYVFLVRAYPVVLFVSKRRLRFAIGKLAGRSMMMNLFSVIACALVIFGSWVQTGFQFGLMRVSESRLALAIGGPFFGFYSLLYLFLAGLYVSLKLSVARH